MKTEQKYHAELILNFISESEEGRGFTEISKFIHYSIFGSTTPWTKDHRGSYCTALYSGAGLLRTFCEQDPATKKWRVVNEIGRPFYPGYLWETEREKVLNQRKSWAFKRKLNALE